MKKKLIILGTLLFTLTSYAQNVGINNSGNAPQQSAGLDINFNNKGVLFPRLTTIERDAIQSPAHSLMIFNTTTECYEGFNSTSASWVNLGYLCPLPVSMVNSASQITKIGFVANWQVINGATSYHLEVSDDAGFSNLLFNANVGNITSYNINSLACDTEYYYRVRTQNSCGIGAYSNTEIITIEACCPKSFSDSRDDKNYNVVQIGNQCWMKENLAYLPSVVGETTGNNTDPYYYVSGYNGTNVATAKSHANYSTYGVL